MPGSLPITEVVPGIFNGLPRLVPRIEFGVDNMTFSNRNRQKIVYMCWEVLEARLGSHKAMDINQE